MSGVANWQAKISIDIEDLKKRIKKAENELDGISEKEHKVKLDLDTKTLESTIQKLDRMLDNIGKGTDNFKQFENLSQQLSSIINDIKNISKAFSSMNDGSEFVANINSITNSLNTLSTHFISEVSNKISSSINDVKQNLLDVGDGEELNPLLQMIDRIENAINELNLSVKNVGLNMNIDVGSDSELEAKIQAKMSNALQAYQRLFEHIKMSGVGGSMVNTNFFEFDINQYDTMMAKIQAYRKFIENMRNETKSQFNGKDILYSQTDKKYWTQAAAAMGQLTRVQNELNQSSESNPLSDLFGSTTDLSGVIEQLSIIVSKLDEISVSANKFSDVFKEGLNVNASVEEIDKLTDRVKELEGELAKIKTSTSTQTETNISSGNSSTASAEKFQQITSDTVNVLSDVGKTEDQIVQKIQKERAEAEANNEVLREHLVLLDKAGKVVANHWGSTSNVNGTYTDEQLSQAQGGKIIHAHPGKASFFGGQDLKHLLQDSMYDQIKQIDLIWGDSTLSVDKSTLTKESSSTLLNIMRNVRKTLTEAYGDNPDGAPSQEAREHINAIEKEIFKTIAQKVNVSVSEEGNMAKEVTDALSDVDKSIIKRFSEIKDSVIKDTDASSIIKNQMKDAFQGNDEIASSSEKVSNAVKEENNILEQNTQKAKENAEAKEKMANADKEVSNANFSKYDNRLESYNKKTSGYDATIARFEDGGWTSDAYTKNVKAVKDAVAEYERILNNLKSHPELVTEKELSRLDEQEKLIKENITAVQNMSAAEKGFTLLSGQKAMDKINSILKENSAMSREAKNQIRAWYNEIASGNPKKNLSQILGEVQKIVNAEAEAGRAGKSMMDSIKEKAWYGVASAIGTYFGFNDIIRYGQKATTTIIDLDTALVDLKKTTTMNSSALEDFYYDANDVAKQMGVTTEEIINQASAWSRLGFSSAEASTQMSKLSAQFAAISPGMDIDTATDGLVSTMKAFDIDVSNVQREVMDNINKIGNTAATSNDEIVDMLTRSSAAMSAANNTLEETIALETAAVEITRSAETTGTAFKTLSMRLRGYDEETESYTNDVEELSGAIADLTKTASTPGGISLFTDDTKQTYKSTYELLKEISEIYDQLSDKNQADICLYVQKCA